MVWIQGRIVFRIRHYWEIRKVVNGHSFILIRQMAALVRRALTEVCTVPVVLVQFSAVAAMRTELQTSIRKYTDYIRA